MSYERYLQLKEKIADLGKGGYMKLSEQEQSEYTQLREQFKSVNDATALEQDELRPKAAIGTPKEQLVISRSELEGLIASAIQNERAKREALEARIEESGALGEWRKLEQEKERKHTAFLKVYWDQDTGVSGLITSWKLAKQHRDAKGYILREDYKISVLTPDGTKEYVVPLVELGQITNREEVDILEKKREKFSKVHGWVTKALKDGEGTWSNNILDAGVSNKKGEGKVQLEEVIDRITVTIRTKNGLVHTMEEKYLNS